MFITYIVSACHRLVGCIAHRNYGLGRFFHRIRRRNGALSHNCETIREDKEEVNMKKPLEGKDLSRQVMLEAIAGYCKKECLSEDEIKALFDGRSLIRKKFKAADISSNYDIVFKLTPKKVNSEEFLCYANALNEYRKKLLKTSFAHRKDIPTDD